MASQPQPESSPDRKRKAEDATPSNHEHPQKLHKLGGDQSGESMAPNPITSTPNGQESKPGKDNKKGSGKQYYNHKSFQHGSVRRQAKDLGRGDYFRQDLDRRGRNEANQEKLAKTLDAGGALPTYMTETFSKAEIDADERRPKRKVAVMLGYSGTGYKGMQISPTEKTIEGDLFAAFVRAGAISKANADDPKKSSLVRCARTDKGVHAAGNVISLKLIIEDPDIVQKINDALPPQIRIWGMERTTGSFSCYQACDSRWYEYLIPTHSFLPPHPSSYMGQHMDKHAEESEDVEGYRDRQQDVLDFWKTVDNRDIKPILDTLSSGTRQLVEKALYHEVTTSKQLADLEGPDEAGIDEENANTSRSTAKATPNDTSAVEVEHNTIDEAVPSTSNETAPSSTSNSKPETLEAIARLRTAYIKAKRDFRISSHRRQRVQDTLTAYLGSNNFHNFTIRKSAKDPSARRLIKSFTVSPPIVINGSEWLSLKVHGQSFMMHQIRKMVGMAALIVRCGTPIARIGEAMSLDTFNIPKAPALGLLLERPVFESYNEKATAKFERSAIDFAQYDAAIEEFKRREIYDQMFRVEEQNHVFHTFFSQIDNFREPTFLFVTSKGLAASNADARKLPSAPVLSRTQKREWARSRDVPWDGNGNGNGDTSVNADTAEQDVVQRSEKEGDGKKVDGEEKMAEKIVEREATVNGKGDGDVVRKDSEKAV